MNVSKSTANGLTLAYEELGDPGGRPLLLVNGLGSQMNGWHDGFLGALGDRGFRLIRFDNRDVGQSSHFSEYGMPDFTGRSRPAPYLLADMADDAAGLLESLSMSPSHVLGVSMGGMIVQMLAIRHPGSVRSMTSIMSTPSRSVGQATPEAAAALMSPRPRDREGAVEHSVRTFRVISSPGFPFDEQWRRASAGVAFDREADPLGRARQLYAIWCSPDRTDDLARLRVPALVVHGADDPLIGVEGGRATAKAIPGAELMVIDGMGHDLPRGVWDQIADAVAALAERADRDSSG